MRKKYTFSIEESEMEKVKALSIETRVPISRYVEDAINEVVKKYEKSNSKENY